MNSHIRVGTGRPARSLALDRRASAPRSKLDRGEKREHYQQIASLREYVLVAQDKREIEVYARPTGGIWQRSIHQATETVELAPIGICFTVDELYNAAGVS
jgi:Uma2 family endonuclease